MTQRHSFLEEQFRRSERARRPFQKLEQARPAPGQPPQQPPAGQPTPPEAPPPEVTAEMLSRVAQPAGQPVAQPAIQPTLPELDVGDLQMPTLDVNLTSPDWVERFYQREGRLPGASDAVLRGVRADFETSKGRPPTRSELLMELLLSLGGTEPSAELEF